MKKLNKEHSILLIIILVLLLGIGYAFLNTQLKINGTADIYDGRWNVHFENYQQTANSTISPTSGNVPVITGDTTTEISYGVNYKAPGDVYEFTIDVVNGGTLNANVVSLESTVMIGSEVVSTLPDYIDYSLTYANGDEYVLPHELPKEESEKLLIRVEYKHDLTLEQYEESKGKTISFRLKLVCVQGENTNIAYVYTNTPGITFHIGGKIPEGVEIYTDCWSIPEGDVFLRHKMVDGKIEKTDIAYYYGDYYFIPPYEIGNQEQFEKTVQYIEEIYGEGYCIFEDGDTEFDCNAFRFKYNERLKAFDSSYYCSIEDDTSICEET